MAKILIITRDAFSHFIQLSTIGVQLLRSGHEVVIATGPSMGKRVEAAGFSHEMLSLDRGGARGLLDSRWPDEFGDPFFDATRRGFVAAASYLVRCRMPEPLFNVRGVVTEIHGLLRQHRPDLVISDQTAFAASVALRAAQRPFVTVMPSHPTMIPGPTELMGYPYTYPACFRPDPSELAALEDEFRALHLRATEVANEALAEFAPQAEPMADVFRSVSSDLNLLSYPESLGSYRRPQLPSNAHFIGPSVREEGLDAELEAVVAASTGKPRVLVSLGTMLVRRLDVIRKIVDAIRSLGWSALVACGMDPDALGPVPSDWVFRSSLPLVALLPRCDLLVTHGGNNSIGEALYFGIPMVISPLFSDQMAGAWDVERNGLGMAFDPNNATAQEIATLLETGLREGDRVKRQQIRSELQAESGPRRAERLMLEAGLLSSA